MKTYTFGTWLDIEAENEEDAISFFDEVMKHSFVSRSHCFEWEEKK
jgi:hypothetical protein